MGGVTGNGKSALLNELARVLGHPGEHFQEGLSPTSTTTAAATLDFTVDGITFSLTDGPGVLDSEGRDAQQLRGTVLHNHNRSYNAFLYAVKIDNRYNQAEQAVVHVLKTIYGDGVFNFCVACLTRSDLLSDAEVQNVLGQWQQTLAQELGPAVPVISTGKGERMNGQLLLVLSAVADIIERQPAPFVPPQARRETVYKPSSSSSSGGDCNIL